MAEASQEAPIPLAAADGGLVLLVPRRNGKPDRDANWAWCKAWWAQTFPQITIYEGHHDVGLFNRSAAINRAAKAAGDWQVAVIIDSDVVLDCPERLGEAIEIARRENVLTMPFSVRRDLSPDGTRRLLAGRTNWPQMVHVSYPNMLSACVVVSRVLWDAVGGFDEQFKGWGYEDNAFAAACETFGGPLVRLPGDLYHLYHETSQTGRPGSIQGEANRGRAELYTQAIGDREAIRALRDGRMVYREPGIPAILHRVVPEETRKEAEMYWKQFRVLHPGWALMTHRDPLDPDDWPLTSPHWNKVKAGAQLADLVRLEALIKWGGIYVDQDVEPYRSFAPLQSTKAFAAWEDARCVPNAVLGATPNHPAIVACLELMIQRLDAGEDIWHCGPGVTTTVLPKRDDVLVLPPGSLYPYHYSVKEQQRGVDYRRTQPWAFCAHHWWGSWLEHK